MSRALPTFLHAGIALVVALASSTPAATAQVAGAAAPLTLEGVFANPSPRQIAWAPDGRRFAMVSPTPRGARVVVVDAEDGSSRELVAGAGPAWSPDGRRLAYVGQGDIWTIAIDGGAPVRVTNDAHDERDVRWSPDGRHLAFSSVRSGSHDVWVVEATGGTPRQLTRGARDADDTRFGASWSPDGRWLAFVSNKSAWDQDDLWVVGLDGGEARQVSRGVHVMSQPQWSPDGRRAAFNGVDHATYWFGDMSDIYVVDVADGRASRVPMQVQASDRNGNQPVFWSRDGAHLYFVLIEAGDVNLWTVPAAGGVATRLTHWPGTLASLAYAPATDRFAFVRATPTEAGLLCVLPASGGVPSVLARPGHRVADGSAPQRVSYRSVDGLAVPGFLFLPPGFDPARRYPALVQVHGGGHNAYMNGFNAVELFLAEQGYVVLAINYRGSSGYGREFQTLSIGDWGGKQALDAVEAGEWLKRQPWSSGRVGIYGGSYGGITTMAAVTLGPDTFAAGVPMRGIYDFGLAYDEADRVGKLFVARGHRGTPAEQPEAYRRSSSLARVSAVKAPLLVMHGGRDVRAPARQHQLLVDALRAAGKTFEQELFLEEPHGFSAASNVRMYGRLLEWFDKYVKGATP